MLGDNKDLFFLFVLPVYLLLLFVLLSLFSCSAGSVYLRFHNLPLSYFLTFHTTFVCSSRAALNPGAREGFNL